MGSYMKTTAHQVDMFYIIVLLTALLPMSHAYASRCYYCDYGNQVGDYGRCKDYNDRGTIRNSIGIEPLCSIKLGYDEETKESVWYRYEGNGRNTGCWTHYDIEHDLNVTEYWCNDELCNYKMECSLDHSTTTSKSTTYINSTVPSQATTHTNKKFCLHLLVAAALTLFQLLAI